MLLDEIKPTALSLLHRRDPLLVGALIASLLLHLVLGVVLALLPRVTQPPPSREPIIVDVVPPLRPQVKPRPYELERPVQPPPPVQPRREQPAKRLGPEERVAPKETAPQGHDTEDQRPTARRAQPAAPQSGAPTPSAPATASPPPAAGRTATLRPTSPLGEFPPEQATGSGRPTPSLEQLTTLAPKTMARLDRDWRSQYREGVAKGDTVWLDTEQDLLISFFKRLKEGIYRVWSYPARARQREQQGACLLRIIVDRQGEIVDVELLESSGSRDLDQEAIRAVRMGGPYGPLPTAYPHPQLKIMANFRYSLHSGYKYPGRIYGQ